MIPYEDKFIYKDLMKEEMEEFSLWEALICALECVIDPLKGGRERP